MIRPPVSVTASPTDPSSLTPVDIKAVLLTGSLNVSVRFPESISYENSNRTGSVVSGKTLVACSAAPLGIGTR